jgi:hypothetical protein
MAVCFSNMGTGSSDMTDDSWWPIPRSVTKCDAAFTEIYWGDKINADETVARAPALTTNIFF